MKLKEMIKNSGKTQKQFSDETGISRAYLSNLITGVKPINKIKINTGKRMARALNVPFYVFVKEIFREEAESCQQ